MATDDAEEEGWGEAHETVLVSIAYKCQGLAWMHANSQEWYDRLNFWLTVPSIVIGTLSGSATLGLDMVPPAFQQPAQVCLGLATLSCGVLTSVNNFMKSIIK